MGEDCKGTWKNGMCIDASSRKRRSCENFENGECQDVKRRSSCDGVMENGVCKTVDRKRRSNDDNDCKKWVNGRCIDPSSSRKRRATTPDDELCVIDEDNDDSDDVC